MDAHTIRDAVNKMDLDTIFALSNILDNAKYSAPLKVDTIEFLTKRLSTLPEEQRKVFWFIISKNEEEL